MAARGQVALEFMFYTAMFVVILTASFLFSANMNMDVISFERKFAAENVCQHFAVLMSAVATSGNGTMVEYFLAPNIGGSDYQVILNSSTVSITVDYLKGSHTCAVPTANFTSVTITNKTGYIKNSGNGVYIE